MSEIKSIFTALFKNGNKKKENHPDYVTKWSKEEGASVVELPSGKYTVAGWIKTSKSGTKYMSLGFSRVEENPTPPPEENFEGAKEIPF